MKRKKDLKKYTYKYSKPLSKTIDYIAEEERKPVLIELKIKIISVLPESWGKEMIEFYYNDSSSCIDNLINQMYEEGKKNCHCGQSEVTYLKDASEEDIKTYSELDFINKYAKKMGVKLKSQFKN